MLYALDRPQIRPIYETLTRGSGKMALLTQNMERGTDQDGIRNKVRMAGKALREARQDNKSDCTLIVAPRVIVSV